MQIKTNNNLGKYLDVRLNVPQKLQKKLWLYNTRQMVGNLNFPHSDQFEPRSTSFDIFSEDDMDWTCLLCEFTLSSKNVWKIRRNKKLIVPIILLPSTPHAFDRNVFSRRFSDSLGSFLNIFFYFKKSQTWLFVVLHFTKLAFLKKNE